ncbi:unnamed protein product [Vicia faba]|uniref:Cation/H+ exchanger transmembrane domain-containing protein n=1 Tax=Vicia faba TaxID=3906 RepID=A0AAV0ZMG0_VICFA|nr:unnamed protein product [Vicia faba]
MGRSQNRKKSVKIFFSGISSSSRSNLLCNKSFEFLSQETRLTKLISQMMTALILGPMVPVLEEYKRIVFPYGSQDTLATITALGYVFFLFETGIKIYFNMIVNTGRKGWVISFFGLIAPMVIGFATRHLTIRNNFENSSLEGDIVIVGHNTTSFAMIVSLLNDLKLLNSELGRLALFVALVGDIFSKKIVTISSTMVNTNHYIPVTMRLGYLFGMVIFILFIYRPVMFWIVEHTPEGKEVKDIYINIVIGTLFLLCWISGQIERGPVFFPFIFGLTTVIRWQNRLFNTGLRFAFFVRKMSR